MKRAKTTGAMTIVKQTAVVLNEASVKARKARLRKGRACGTQSMLWWFSNQTSIPTRPHKHFAEFTSYSNIYGPVALEAWNELHTMTVTDNRTIWGNRRVACGGKPIAGEDKGDERSEDAEEGGGDRPQRQRQDC